MQDTHHVCCSWSSRPTALLLLSGKEETTFELTHISKVQSQANLFIAPSDLRHGVITTWRDKQALADSIFICAMSFQRTFLMILVFKRNNFTQRCFPTPPIGEQRFLPSPPFKLAFGLGKQTGIRRESQQLLMIMRPSLPRHRHASTELHKNNFIYLKGLGFCKIHGLVLLIIENTEKFFIYCWKESASTQVTAVLNKSTSLQLLSCFLYFYALRKSIATILKTFPSKVARVTAEVVVLFKLWHSEFWSSIKQLCTP